jgi:hypothetical protein
MSELDFETVRSLLREVLAERDRLATEEQRQAQEQAEQEYLASIRRRDLTPKEKSLLIDKLGPAGYLALPWGEPDQPRDSNGRFRR